MQHHTLRSLGVYEWRAPRDCEQESPSVNEQGEHTISRMPVNLLAPKSKARRIRAKLDLFTLRPRLFVGNRGSMMLRNLVWKALGWVLLDSGEKPGGLYMCRRSAMNSSFSSGRSFMSGKGRAAGKGSDFRAGVFKHLGIQSNSNPFSRVDLGGERSMERRAKPGDVSPC